VDSGIRDFGTLSAGARKTGGFQVSDAPPSGTHYAARQYWAASIWLVFSGKQSNFTSVVND